MDAAEETKNVEELEEEVEEEEVEDEVEEEEGGGGGEGVEKVLDNVDSAGEEIKQLASGPSSAGKIFVGGVAWETTEETFTQHFMKYGDITDSVIMKEKHTQKPRGFGFVTFSEPSVVDKVLEDEHVIDGRMVEVKRTVPRGDMAAKGLGAKTRKIFVGGIPTSLTEDELEEHFSAYGKVVEHQIMLDHASGRSRGFGFVTFESEDPVEKLISDGRMHDLNGKQVEIKKAEPKKSGGGPGINGRAGYTSGNAYGSFGGSTHGYVGGYQSGSMYYGGRSDGGYGRGYGYGSGPGYGAAYGAGYGAPVYETGGYGSANGYGNPRGYGGAYGLGRIFRYHPYGR